MQLFYIANMSELNKTFVEEIDINIKIDNDQEEGLGIYTLYEYCLTIVNCISRNIFNTNFEIEKCLREHKIYFWSYVESCTQSFIDFISENSTIILILIYLVILLRDFLRNRDEDFD